MRLDFENRLNNEFDMYESSYNYFMRKTIKLLNRDPNFILEVLIVDEQTIKEINRDYRNKDAVTDVISFALDDEVEGEIVARGQPNRLLGTIIICGPVAERQAQEYNHSLKREMKFLFVHGLLHLLGYDHMNKEDEIEMFALQDKIIGKRK
ncbi:MAG TPA: rRNA maturation RNase YbeY [Bacilli bacterium]|nr:rRNA maturation RNase YbeY [Bacilli bacterium]